MALNELSVSASKFANAVAHTVTNGPDNSMNQVGAPWLAATGIVRQQADGLKMSFTIPPKERPAQWTA